MDNIQKYNRALSNLRQEVGKLKTALFTKAKVNKQLEKDKVKLSQENTLLKRKISTLEKELASLNASKSEADSVPEKTKQRRKK
jgi:prefoldin subunit 5